MIEKDRKHDSLRENMLISYGNPGWSPIQIQERLDH